MSGLVEAIRERWGEPTTTAAAPPTPVPDELRELWAAVGLAGFGHGRLWLTDPAAWQPAADAWADPSWSCISRNAFGTMRLWRPGELLTVNPVRGWIVPAAGLGLADALCSRDPDDLDLFDPDDKPLFRRTLDRLGPTAADTVYGVAGGLPTIDTLTLLPAVAHVTALAATTERIPYPDVTG